MKAYTLLGVSLVLVGLVIVMTQQARAQGDLPPLPPTTPPLTTQEAAVARAIDFAHTAGLQAKVPEALVAREMRLADWFTMMDFKTGPDAAKFGIDPAQDTWVVAMRGKVIWAYPGNPTGERQDFDNITLVLNKSNGELISTFTAGPGQTPPIPVP